MPDSCCLLVVIYFIGMFYYSVISDPPDMDTSFLVIIKDDMEINVFTSTNQSGAGILKDVKPWWPRGMGDPTLYLLEVCFNCF